MRPPHAPKLTSALGFRVTRLSLLFRRRLMRALAGWEMTPEQWQVLAAVAERAPGDLTQNDLVDLTLKDRHSISRMVDRMERDGWLERRPHPNDARAVTLYPTRKTQREVERMRASLVASFEPLFARIAPERRALFAALIDELTAIFEAEDE